MKRIYLAGPDVFRSDAKAYGEELKAACQRAGFEGLFPLDNEIEKSTNHAMASAIRDANMAMIASCDVVIANLSPFRGPEPDSGTVFEIGYALALKKDVIAYSSDRRSLKERTQSMLNLGASAVDHDNLSIEDFDLSHNLMFAHLIQASTFEEALALL